MRDQPDRQAITLTVSTELYSIIATANTGKGNNEEFKDDKCESRTDLDSHANMPVVGSNCQVIRQTGKTVTVSPFTPDYEPMNIPVVDATVLYRCPFSGKEYILVIMNALYVPSMSHNLIAPFIIRDAGVALKTTPKIQCKDPDEYQHALTFDDSF